MGTEIRQRERALREVILGLLRSGTEPTLSLIESRLTEFLQKHDPTGPFLKARDFSPVKEEPASAKKRNELAGTISGDLQVLYDEMGDLSTRILRLRDRWKTEADQLEARMRQLEEELSSLLLIEQDTEGYFGFVGDSFEDTSLIDIDLTTAQIDLANHAVAIGPGAAASATRINLNSLPEEDALFILLSRRHLQAVVSAPESSLSRAFDDTEAYWQHRVYVTSREEPVLAELKVKLSDSPKNINKIVWKGHSSNTSSPLQVTVFSSTDGVSFAQLPIQDFTKDVIHSTSWIFPTLGATHIKFLLSKRGPDVIDGALYVYEFGAEEIIFYEQGYEQGTAVNKLITTPLAVRDEATNNPVGFNKLMLEVCERVPESTNIRYYVTVSNDSAVPVRDSTIWIPIDPRGREAPIFPTILSVGDLTDYELTDVQISYDAAIGLAAINRNPDLDFTLLQANGTTSSITTTNANRYGFLNSNDRILSMQIHDDFEFDLESLKVWRNTGGQNVSTLVRGIQRGWGLADPYYHTSVSVETPAGLVIDFGPKPILIDETPRTGLFTLTAGIHHIKVQRENWVTLASTPNSFDALRAADPLFPYNHKYLIEGWPMSDIRNPYQGVDLFAEFLMQRVSPFDVIHNIAPDDYLRFALDVDTGDAEVASSTVILLKVDEEAADSLNERFRIDLKSIGQQFNFLRLKVDFTTEDSTVSPALDAYRIRLGR